jgi:hypothetical protein
MKLKLGVLALAAAATFSANAGTIILDDFQTPQSGVGAPPIPAADVLANPSALVLSRSLGFTGTGTAFNPGTTLTAATVNIAPFSMTSDGQLLIGGNNSVQTSNVVATWTFNTAAIEAAVGAATYVEVTVALHSCTQVLWPVCWQTHLALRSFRTRTLIHAGTTCA